ncbi:MAG: hypothetical protein EAZ47_01590 [Bacteroidetes bacterium]|jgi:hypothetical protein|nr:MAG: hypothetical protein EAY72_05040 [Bacteroidota bacterium]TAF97638.1 MAG: hypothetical protein EAZ47_01590 [Bacteroidota bacterium]
MKQTLFVLGLCVCFCTQLAAQKPTPQLPLWAPAKCGDASFLFIPAVDMYYDVAKQQFIYQSKKGKLKFSPDLPKHIVEDDLFNLYKVIINHPAPYLNFAGDRARYAGFALRRGQQTVREYLILSKMEGISFEEEPVMAKSH